jgi:hypothetical protein
MLKPPKPGVGSLFGVPVPSYVTFMTIPLELGLVASEEFVIVTLLPPALLYTPYDHVPALKSGL